MPLTKEGNIMVDGVLASCYADAPHDLAHFIMTPMQKYSEVMDWIFGEENRFLVYVDIARNLGLLTLPNGQYFI